MADLKEKKFGYVVQPPPPPHIHPHPHPHPFLPPLPPGPVPPGMTVQDWMTYINSYIDVRARQLYDKLKSLYSQQLGNSDDDIHNYILFRDQGNNKIYKLFMYNGSVHTDEHTVDPNGRSVTVVNGQTIVWDDRTKTEGQTDETNG
jgi:hypothetical protein